MNIEDIINILDKFARENTFFSILILAVLGNLIYDAFKKIMYYVAISSKKIAKSTGKGISEWNRKNIEFLIKNYRNDLIKVEKVKNKEREISFELLYELHRNMLMFFIMLIFYFIVLKADNPIIFYSFLGGSARYLIAILSSMYYNTTLFENAKKIEKYKLKKEKRINLLENLLEK